MQIDFSKILTELSYQPGQPMIFSSGLFMLLFTAFLGIYSFVYKNERKRILYLIAFSLFFLLQIERLVRIVTFVGYIFRFSYRKANVASGK